MTRFSTIRNSKDFEGKTLGEIQVLSGLNWEVEKTESHYYYKAPGESVPQLRKHAGQFTNYRKDNGDALGMVGNDFNFAQPDYYFEAIGRLREFHDLEITGAYALNGGAICSIHMKSRAMSDFRVNDRDVTTPYLDFRWGYNGKQSPTFSGFAFRELCLNTLPLDATAEMRANLTSWNSFAKEFGSGLTLRTRNTQKVESRLRKFEREIVAQFQKWEMMKSAYIRFAETEADEKTLEEIYLKVYGELKEDATKNAVTRRENAFAAIRAIYRGETCAATSGDTLWSVYNALTEQVDHPETVRKNATDDSRHVSNVMGANMKLKERIFNVVASYV